LLQYQLFVEKDSISLLAENVKRNLETNVDLLKVLEIGTLQQYPLFAKTSR